MTGVYAILFLSTAEAADCAAWSAAEVTGQLAEAPPESSGLAASRSRPGVWFTHDDRGGDAVLTAFRLDGTHVGDHRVTNATNEDWEDLAAAPCPDDGDCVYIGDIGDNDGTRGELTVYAVEEPPEGDDTVKARFRWVGVYPDGAHDAEALLVHPCTGRIHVVTKEGDGQSAVYRFPPFPDDGDVVELEKVADVVIDGPVADARRVSGGDWDPDGERVVLRTASEILEWRTAPDAPNAHWGDPPQVLTAADEAQGEAVAYGIDGSLVTTAEGVPMSIWTRTCTEPVPAVEACGFPQTGRSCGCAVSASAVEAAVWGVVRGVRRRSPRR